MTEPASTRRVVAVLSPAYPVLSETFVQRDVEGLRRLGFTVVTVGLRDGDVSGSADVVVYPRALWGAVGEFLRRPLRTLSTLARSLWDTIHPRESTAVRSRLKLLVQGIAGIGLAGRLRKEGVRHLHCHFAHSPTSVGMYAAIQLGVGFSFVGHANDIFRRRHLLLRKLERAAFVACISEWHRALYDVIKPGLGEKALVIRCGVDVSDWAPEDRAGNENPEFRLVSVARLVEKKGLDTVIDALARPEAHGTCWTVIGDGPLRQDLKARAEQAGLEKRVLWRGAVPNDEVRRAISASDLFVLPCRPSATGDRDGIPVVLMEAMAAGIPVIAGDLPAIRELVVDDSTGWLLAAEDSGRLAVLIGELREKPGRRMTTAAAAREHVVREFSAEVNHARLSTALRKAIDGN